MENKFNLIYKDAITENIEGKVNIHKFNYKVKGIEVEGNIYLPPTLMIINHILQLQLHIQMGDVKNK